METPKCCGYVGGGPPNSEEISLTYRNPGSPGSPGPVFEKFLEASQGSLIHPGAGPGNLNGSDENDEKKNDKLDSRFFGDVLFYQF